MFFHKLAPVSFFNSVQSLTFATIFISFLKDSTSYTSDLSLVWHVFTLPTPLE